MKLVATGLASSKKECSKLDLHSAHEKHALCNRVRNFILQELCKLLLLRHHGQGLGPCLGILKGVFCFNMLVTFAVVKAFYFKEYVLELLIFVSLSRRNE